MSQSPAIETIPIFAAVDSSSVFAKQLLACLAQLRLTMPSDSSDGQDRHYPTFRPEIIPSQTLDDLRSGLSKEDAPVQLALVSLDKLCESVGGSLADKLASLHTVSNAVDLKIIVIATEDSDPRLNEALTAGAVDFITVTLPAALLTRKIESIVSRALSLQFEKQRQVAMLESYEHLQHEQQVAKQVFDKVALEMIELENVRYWMSPLNLFSGDVLLSTPTPSGGLLLLMGDFTGHGLGAAIGAIPLASSFYGMASKGFALQDIVKEINKKLHETLPVGIFCCATAIQLDFSTGELEVWNAGLPDAFVLRKGSNTIENIKSSALALGILSPQVFTFESTRMKLAPGDKLYLLTDGLSETNNAEGLQYGEARLRETLLHTLDLGVTDTLTAIKDDVLHFIGHTDRSDDISLVEVSYVTDQQFSSFYKQAEKLDFQAPVSWALDFEFRPDSLKFQDPVPLILRNLVEEPSLRQYSGRLFSIVSELFNNALDHGLLKLDSSLKYGNVGFAEYYEERIRRLNALQQGYIRCKLDYNATSEGGRLVVEVIDSGEGFNHKVRHSQNSSQPQLHGRGLPLIASVTESLEFIGNGNHAKAVFSWS